MSTIQGGANLKNSVFIENYYQSKNEPDLVKKNESSQESEFTENLPLENKTKNVEKTALATDEVMKLLLKLQDEVYQNKKENDQSKIDLDQKNEQLKIEIKESIKRAETAENNAEETKKSLTKRLDDSESKAEEAKKNYEESDRDNKLEIKRLNNRVITLELIVVEKEKKIEQKDREIKDLIERVDLLVKDKEFLSKEKFDLHLENQKLKENFDLKEMKIVELEHHKESKQTIEDRLQNGLEAEFRKNAILEEENKKLQEQLTQKKDNSTFSS